MEGLDQVVVGAGSKSLATVLGLVLREQQNDRRVSGGTVLHSKPADDGEPVNARKVRRDQDERRPVRARGSQGLGAIAESDRLISGLGESIAESPLDGRVGIDY